MSATPGGPGIWEQATSTRGGRLAVGIAITLACLLALSAGVALVASARGDRTAPVSAARSDTKGADEQKSRNPGQSGQAPGQAKKSANGQSPTDIGKGDLESIPGRMGGTLHGEVTRPTAAGTETLLVQTGTVTAAGATEVTVKSTDGFTETYAFGSATQVRGPAKSAGLATGTEVTVVAAKDGKRALLVASKGASS